WSTTCCSSVAVIVLIDRTYPAGAARQPDPREATCGSGGRAERCRLQGDSEHLVDGHREVEVHRVANLLGDIVEIPSVALRKHDIGETGSMGGQHLLLDATDRQNPTLQGDFSGHPDRVFH